MKTYTITIRVEDLTQGKIAAGAARGIEADVKAAARRVHANVDASARNVVTLYEGSERLFIGDTLPGGASD